MNTFALILLAFPFYLAVNGKLISYTSLASSSAAPSAPPSTGPSPLSPVTPLGAPGGY